MGQVKEARYLVEWAGDETCVTWEPTTSLKNNCDLKTTFDQEHPPSNHKNIITEEGLRIIQVVRALPDNEAVAHFDYVCDSIGVFFYSPCPGQEDYTMIMDPPEEQLHEPSGFGDDWSSQCNAQVNSQSQ